MNAIVVYRSKYGSTKKYAEWIAEELGIECRDAKGMKASELLPYDTIILGGGLYAEVIAGATLITKNFDMFRDKKLIIYTTGLTPIDCRDYYDKLVIEKNFKNGEQEKIKIFNFLGKMIIEELSLPHRAALKTLKKIMSGKENPTEMEKLLIHLCDVSEDMTDRNAITELCEYARKTEV